MNRANPVPLGLIGFGVAAWLFGLLNVGWYSGPGLAVVAAAAFALGAVAMFISGGMAVGFGHSVEVTWILGFASFWLALFLWVIALGGGGGTLVAWLFLLWGAFAFIVWLSALRRDLGLMVFFLAVWLSNVLVALGHFGAAGFTEVGGFVGLASAVVAFYAAAAHLIGDTAGQSVLPMGRRQG